jgi:DNA-binding GntR family transcriptional regulator
MEDRSSRASVLDRNEKLSGASRSTKRSPHPSTTSKPAKDLGDAGDPGRIDVSDRLLRKLIRDVSFLRTPRSEAKTAEELGVNKSALREAVIGFVRNGWLRRSEDGISRDELEVKRLIQLYAVRFLIERTALGRVIDEEDKLTRQGIVGDLTKIVNQQEDLHKCREEEEDKRVDWYSRSVDLHVTIVNKVGLEELASILHTILWRIRIGSCIPLESEDVRRLAMDGHWEIIKRISDLNARNAEDYIQKHIREPMKRALGSLGIIRFEGSTDQEVERQIQEKWEEVLHLFPGPLLNPSGASNGVPST